VVGALAVLLLVVSAGEYAKAARLVRDTLSPPVAVCKWIRAHVRPGEKLYLTGSMIPFADYYLADYPRSVIGDTEIPRGEGYLIDESGGGSLDSSAIVFDRPARPLSTIVRQRYFAASVTPLPFRVVMARGWYDEESDGTVAWRWMGRTGELLLSSNAHGELTIDLEIPSTLLALRPTITTTLNDQTIDTFTPATLTFARRYVIRRFEGSQRLLLRTTHVAQAAGDPRELGVRLDRIAWRASE
jgi:hypothetical protein